MGLTFNCIHATPAGGRRGRMELPHRAVETPVFMPVGTAGSVKAVPQDILESLGAELILGNTYHLYLRPGHEAIRRMGGLHRFISWSRAMLTDSGGFQVFSLSQLRKVTDEGVRFRSHLDGSSHFFTPEHSMDVQIALGADIAMAFDECTEYPAERSRAEESLRLTMAWARRSLEHFRAHQYEVPWADTAAPVSRFVAPASRPAVVRASSPAPQAGQTQSLFGIVQGGMYCDLRRQSAEQLIEMDFDGYAIGGLSVGEPRDLTLEMISEVLPLLPADKPRYVMGVGYPDEIEQYARMGVDMMDCVLPTRAARHGLLFTSQGRMTIKNRQYAEDQRPPDENCNCMVCRRYTRAYLRHLMQAGEPLSATLNTIHNLAYYLGIMERVRASLEAGAAGPQLKTDN
ncbi:MAG TPA: tRNA guanosine(34) transglycosylase Tgt [Terracidiphilus sp.]|nr:tRNA guanosine(34) transglycosylase Tgt [Terracidiphilus sp.]